MHERGTPVTEVCGHYGISRKTFYKWYGRYQESGRDFHALKDRSRRPHTHPRSVPKRVEERVVAMRRKTRYGPRRLAYYLAQEGISISVYGVYRVLQRAGLIRKRTLQASQEASELRHGCPRPASPDRRQVPATLAPEGPSGASEAIPLQRHRRLHSPTGCIHQL